MDATVDSIDSVSPRAAMSTTEPPPVKRASVGRRVFRRVARAITLAFLERAITRVSLDVATTREHLETAESDLMRAGLPPEVRVDVQSDVVNLRHRLDAYLEELAYVVAKRDILLEDDGTCPCRSA